MNMLNATMPLAVCDWFLCLVMFKMNGNAELLQNRKPERFMSVPQRKLPENQGTFCAGQPHGEAQRHHDLPVPDTAPWAPAGGRTTAEDRTSFRVRAHPGAMWFAVCPVPALGPVEALADTSVGGQWFIVDRC